MTNGGPALELDPHRADPSAGIVRHIGLHVGGGDCQLIVTGVQVPRDVDADQVRVPAPDAHLASR